ncbi:hypothetical protein A1OU_07440 [Enterovibrio norvegicus]|nr:hypothetical protein A1OU_07440 [Enterovibrio norvegicus]
MFLLNVYAEAIHLEEMKRFPFLDALNSEFNMIAAIKEAHSTPLVSNNLFDTTAISAGLTIKLSGVE